MLIVDDEEEVREVLREGLAGRGYDVTFAETAVAALAAAQERRPDVVLLDLYMPGALKGADIMKRLSAIAPVVILSSTTDEALCRRLLAEGAFDFMPKPFDFARLTAVIAAAVAQGPPALPLGVPPVRQTAPGVPIVRGDRRWWARLARALRESREQYRLVVDHINDAVLLMDLQANVTFANRRVQELTGYEVDELIGQPVTMLLTAEGLKGYQERYRIIVLEGQDRPLSYETEIVRRDGSKVWVEANSTSVLRDGKVVARLVAARDISERKRAEEERRRSETALMKYAERLSVLHQIDRAIIAAEAPSAIAEATLWRLRDLLGVPRAIVHLFDLAAGEAELLAAVGPRRSRVGPGVRYPLRLAGDLEALRRGEPQVMDLTTLSPGADVDSLIAADVRIYVVVPLLVRAELIGSMSFGLVPPPPAADRSRVKLGASTCYGGRGVAPTVRPR